MPRKRTDLYVATNNAQSFGTRVKEIRISKKMSVYAFAEKVGICRSYVSQIESGDKLPSLETFLLIVRALEVTPNDLLIDYVDSDKLGEIYATKIAMQLNELTEEQKHHIQEVLSAEITFLKKH